MEHLKTPLLGILCVLVLLAGCATPETRAKERPAAFAQLPASTQAAVLKGKIDVGMNADALYIALGAPARKKISRTSKGDEERWIYFRTEFDEIPNWSRDYYRTREGVVVSIPRYDPIQVTRQEPDFEVILLNGKIVSWQRL
jgi:hypothetical protein